MTYIIGWLVNYCCYVFSPRKIAALVAVLTVGLIISLRGPVGTDVAMYTYIAENVQTDASTEPLFRLIVLVSTWMFPNPQLAVTMGIGGLFTSLLVIYAMRSDTRELFVLHTFYIPVFCYEHGINALRIGLACLLLMLGVQCYNRQQIKFGLILAASAVFIQYTSLFLIFWWCLLTLRYRPLKGALFVLLGGGLAGCFVLMAPAYLSVKWALYFAGTFQTPSPASGLGVVGGILIVLLGYVLDIGAPLKVKYITVTLLLLIGCMGVTFISYAGLRFLNLLYLAVVLGIVTLFQRDDLCFGKWLKVCIVLAGISGSIFTYKHFLEEKNTVIGNDSSNSLPYNFFWE